MNSKLWSFLARILCAGILLLILAFTLDISKAVALIQEQGFTTLALCVGIALLRVPLGALRWSIMDPSEDIPLWDYIRYLMTNGFINLFVPMLAGDATRALHTAAEGKSAATALSVFADRLLGFFSILLLGAGAILVSPPFEGRWRLLMMLGGGVTLIIAMTASLRFVPDVTQLSVVGRLPERVQGVLKKWTDAVHFYARSPGQILAALAVCIPLHGLWLVLVWVFARALAIPISFWELSSYTALVMVITAIPVSLNGLGVREMGYSVLFAARGLPAEAAVALSLYQFATLAILGLMGVPFFLTRPKKHER